MHMSRPFRRVRYIPQLEMTECGAASLAMILDYHGNSVPLVEVRAACDVGRNGLTAARIIQAAEQLGLSAKGYSLDMDCLRQLPLPAILHWEFNHFVVLEKVHKAQVSLVDPAVGRRRVSTQEFARAFTGVALAFEPAEGSPRRRAVSPSFARYRSALARYRRPVALALGTAAALETLAVFVPASTQILIDHVLSKGRESWLLPIVVGLASAMLGMLLLTALRDRLIWRLQFAVDADLATALVEHMLKLPLQFFHQRAAGDLLQRVEAQKQMREVTIRTATAFLDALLVMTYGLMMLAYEVRLAGIVLALGLVRVGVMLGLKSPAERAVASEMAARGREVSAAVDALAVPEVVKAFAAEDLLWARYDTKLTERLGTTLAREAVAARASHLEVAIDAVSAASVIWFGGHFVMNEEMTLGVLASFVSLHTLFQAPLRSAVEALFELTHARGALARIDDVLQTAPETSGQASVQRIEHEIRFENVGYRPGTHDAWICRGVNLCLARGEKVAIVGRSGQGKSTLVRLLLGIQKPSEGRILVDGVDLGDIDRSSWLQAVGVVLQEPFFFDDSVRANLSMGDERISLHTMRWAAKIACVDGVIADLSQGYETVVGENARTLSGGQRQRLALARALCRNPPLLVLDEATSSLDGRTEAAVHRNLAQLGATRVLIAHRLQTVLDADRIVVIEGGRVVQEGSYSELTRAPGLFRQMADVLPQGVQE